MLEGETLEEYWCTQRLRLARAWNPNLILDDGGDATLLVVQGAEFEVAGSVPDYDPAKHSEEYGVVLDLLKKSLVESPNRWTQVRDAIKGVSEETATGVHRLYQMAKEGNFLLQRSM